MERKRRILGKIVIPYCTRELLQQFEKAMKALEGVVIPPPYGIEDFARLFEHFPLLASPVSGLHPSDCRCFWETYGVWLLEKSIQPKARMSAISPSIGHGAHPLDIQVLAFASHYPWPSVIWRDVHCYRCTALSIINRGRSFNKKCSKHRCQVWAKQLLHSRVTPDPKWSQFTDIRGKYDKILAFRSSSEDLDLYHKGEDNPLCFTNKPALAWSPNAESRTDIEESSSLDSKESTNSCAKSSEPDTQFMVNKPLQYLEQFKERMPSYSQRKRDLHVKMKKSKNRYTLVDAGEVPKIKPRNLGSVK